MADITGKIVNRRYRVEKFIDAGGMSLVYRVWDTDMNVPLAMKVLRSDLLDDPKAMERFEREGRALRKLAHPHIVPFYGIERSEGEVFLLEQYIDGATLKQILGREPEGQLPALEALIYLKAVCAALGYAHTNGVVHCDIKPGNVMVDRGGNIFLTDFGIARHAESTTTTLAGAGSPSYMAPEQIKGLPVSPATDVYSLGVMLFEMLTGRRPFTGTEVDSASASNATGAERVRSAHLTLPPPDPRSLNPDIPPVIAELVLCALEKDPDRRPASAMELFNAACTALGLAPEQVPDRAVPPTLTHPPIPGPQDVPQDNPRRTKWGWLAGLAALGVIGMLAGFATLGGRGLAALFVAASPTPPITASPNVIATLTPPPTYTPYPTHTPQPTFTLPPTATQTPRPTSTRRPTATHEPPTATPVQSYYFLVSNPNNVIMQCRVNGSYWGDVYPYATGQLEYEFNSTVTLKCCPQGSNGKCFSRTFTFNTPGMLIEIR